MAYLSGYLTIEGKWTLECPLGYYGKKVFNKYKLISSNCEGKLF
jgi:hypothetical protein